MQHVPSSKTCSWGFVCMLHLSQQVFTFPAASLHVRKISCGVVFHIYCQCSPDCAEILVKLSTAREWAYLGKIDDRYLICEMGGKPSCKIKTCTFIGWNIEFNWFCWQLSFTKCSCCQTPSARDGTASRR